MEINLTPGYPDGDVQRRPIFKDYENNKTTDIKTIINIIHSLNIWKALLCFTRPQY